MRLILAFLAAALIGFAPASWADTELTFYYPIAVGGPLTKVIDGYAAEFEKQNPGVKVKPIYAGNYDDARIKALAYASTTGITAIAEDSGLEIDSMSGQPGVHSARFMGVNASYPNRFAEIFRRIDRHPRDARFKTALAVARGREILFETETSVDGEIAHGASGEHGFGYDPIFFYPPFQLTTAQLPDRDKAAISHRARAFRDLRRWLSNENAIRLFRIGTIS